MNTNNDAYRKALVQLQNHVGDYMVGLTDIHRQITDGMGFIRVATNHSVDTNWLAGSLHDHLQSLSRKIKRLQDQLRRDSACLTGAFLKEDLQYPHVGDPKLRWAIELIEQGANLMTIDQLGQWAGIRTFLESFTVEDNEHQ